MVELSIDIASEVWQRRVPDAEAILARTAQAVLAQCAPALTHAEISVVLGDDAAVQALNNTYRKLDKPTNVLSFPSGVTADGNVPVLLGDVIFASGTIAQEAAEQGKSLRDHFTHLIVHGVLHLLGYDHQTDVAAQEMEALEVQLLAGLGIRNPYKEDVLIQGGAHG